MIKQPHIFVPSLLDKKKAMKKLYDNNIKWCGGSHSSFDDDWSTVTDWEWGNESYVYIEYTSDGFRFATFSEVKYRIDIEINSIRANSIEHYISMDRAIRNKK